MKFPSFSDRCPICHGRDCAVRIGYYYRSALELQLNEQIIIFYLVPVPRYLCREKQKSKMKHRTFSLLPDMLIPYCRISINLLIYILQHLIEQTHTTAQTLNKLDAISPDACMLSEKTIRRLLNLFEKTRIKLILFFQQYGDRYHAPPEFSSYNTVQTFNFIIKYPDPQEDGLNCPAYWLSRLYYKQCGSYIKNAHFLFGTAAQFCK